MVDKGSSIVSVEVVKISVVVSGGLENSVVVNSETETVDIAVSGDVTGKINVDEDADCAS